MNVGEVNYETLNCFYSSRCVLMAVFFLYHGDEFSGSLMRNFFYYLNSASEMAYHGMFINLFFFFFSYTRTEII
jgi:hypothetical protein